MTDKQDKPSPTTVVTLRVDSEWFAQVAAAADRLGIPPGRFIRNLSEMGFDDYLLLRRLGLVRLVLMVRWLTSAVISALLRERVTPL